MVRHLLPLLVLLSSLSACCDEKAIPKLRQQLYSQASSERNEAALSLARCGAAASAAVPRLAQLMYDKNVGVQSSAAYALRKIDTPSARAALKEAEDARRKR
jgi:HEAT repeat protein